VVGVPRSPKIRPCPNLAVALLRQLLGVSVHQVQIEVILLSVADDLGLRWRVARGNLPSGCRPDTRARELAGLTAAVPTATVVHSTSWRPTPDGLILTYAVLPDPAPTEGTVRAVPADAKVVSSSNAANPTPPIVTVEHVLAHALRHLSMVARTSHTVAKAVDVYSELWHAVVTHTPDVAGQLVGT
jgi:hypothetical protein